MHEEGIQRYINYQYHLRGSIEERKHVVGKINALQKQVEAGEINFYLFYKEVIAMKHTIENKIL
tara:strand:- start:313 stop:504 length:192 start_codon:yes stop_codon:yes gene_type:complete